MIEWKKDDLLKSSADLLVSGYFLKQRDVTNFRFPKQNEMEFAEFYLCQNPISARVSNGQVQDRRVVVCV